MRDSWCSTRSLAAALAAIVVASSSVHAAPLEGFADLVQQVRPAVVNIAAMRNDVARPQAPLQETVQDPPGEALDDLIRRLLAPFGDDRDDARSQFESLGSGFIVDASGLVVTSVHVIQHAEQIRVTLADGRRFESRLIGRDDETDIALLQIASATPLPFVSWGDSDASRVGDWVIAVGNPFGLGGTVTAGIISARGRDIQSGRYDDYLQIDAPINRGNSGGPTFDTNGRVIGINSAIISTGGGSIGIGFATPSSVARPVVDELRHRGHVERGWLGVTIQPVTRGIADSLGLEAEGGALVSAVVPGGPAAAADLRQGDVVLAVNGRAVDQFRDLSRLVAATGPDRMVRLRVWRDGSELTVPVTLARTPSESSGLAPGQEPPPPRPVPPSTTALGLTLLPIDRETRERFGLPDDAQGALVVGASPTTGLLPGDIITKVGSKAVTSPRDVLDGVREARTAGRKAVLLLVRRLGTERFFAVPLG